MQRPSVGQFPARHPTPQVLHDPRCRLDAHVGDEKTGFEFLEHLLVDGALAENEVANAVGELAARAGERTGQARPEGAAGVCVVPFVRA